MYSRPKKSESEEDLLKLQDEYYNNLARNVINPAAKLVKPEKYVRKEPTEDPKQIESVPNINIVPKNVMSGIVEKNEDFKKKPVSITKFSKGFPKASKRQMINQKEQKCSIFAAEMAKKHHGENVLSLRETPMQIDIPVQEPEKISDMKSFILNGPDSEIIHKENVSLLNKMSIDEILMEKRKLLESMDPKLIQFIKSKRQKEDSVVQKSMEIEQFNNEMDTKINTSDDMAFNIDSIDLLAHPDSKKWLNFDKIEVEKFEWMKGINRPVSVKPDDPYEARFDFAGYLLPYTDEITEKTRILYHHGEEPGRPGYTLQELLQLCRSSFHQQCILSLNTIANLLSLYNTGIYDGIIELPIEQIFFVIRFSLDENVVPVMTASLKAIHNMFYFQIDEICLDSLLCFNFGLVQPILELKQIETKTNQVKDEDLNDQQMSETNLVKCLLRTNILVRIRYILNNIKPPEETVILCLELLIRLSRDKQASLVYNCENLIDIIISNFIPSAHFTSYEKSSYKKPMLTALKLMRVLMSRSKHITTEVIKKNKLLEILLSYLASDASSTDIVKIQTEAMFLWAVVLHYRVSIDIFLELQPILLRILNFHIRSTNIGNSSYAVQAHTSAALCLVSAIGRIGNHILLEPFIPLINEYLQKYTGQVLRLESIKCGDLQIISSIYKCWSEIQTVQLPWEVPNSLLKSCHFEMIAKNIKSSSNLMCAWSPHDTGAALDSLKTSIWNAPCHVVPILHTESCLLFLAAFSSYLCASKNYENIIMFMNMKSIKKYFKSLMSGTFNLVYNWFTRIEAQFIMNCLKMSIIIQDKLNEIEKIQVYTITIKCIHIFRSEMKSDVTRLLIDVIFNKNFFVTDSKAKQLEVIEFNNVLINSLTNINEIIKMYIEELRLNKNFLPLDTTISISNNDDCVLPSDWIYMPIISLFSKYQHTQENESNNDEEELLVLRSLQWIIIYETLFPDLVKSINVTDRFCRLCCVFLCSNSVFLEENIKILIHACLHNIIKNDCIQKLAFDKEIQGLNNFQDFYTVLLEQFQAVSYGDILFSNFIMIPLAQIFNVKWKKILWSEYAAATQCLILSENELLVPVDIFLFPIETDISVIRCYQRALTSGHLKRSPLLRKIAEHHVKEYKNKNKTTV